MFLNVSTFIFTKLPFNGPLVSTNTAPHGHGSESNLELGAWAPNRVLAAMTLPHTRMLRAVLGGVEVLVAREPRMARGHGPPDHLPAADQVGVGPCYLVLRAATVTGPGTGRATVRQ